MVVLFMVYDFGGSGLEEAMWRRMEGEEEEVVFENRMRVKCYCEKLEVGVTRRRT